MSGGEEGVKFPEGCPTIAGVIENVDSRVSSRKFMGNTIQGFLSWADDEGARKGRFKFLQENMPRMAT